MKGPIFTLAEAAKEIGVDQETLGDWVKSKVVAPSVMANRSDPLFGPADLQQLNQIKHLQEIGYDLAEIRKIAKKVGLPQPEAKLKKQREVTNYLTVGELAERTKLNTRTIKHWEERGIFEPASRSEGGFRLYSKEHILFCRLISDLQLFGYTLEEIKEVADLLRIFDVIQNGKFSGSDEQTVNQLDEMSARIISLFSRMEELTKGVARWRKLLREKRSEILTLRKKQLKKQERSLATQAKVADTN